MKDSAKASRTGEYEKPTIRRHAIIMTMAPAGSKMGHGLFPFVTKPGHTATTVEHQPRPPK